MGNYSSKIRFTFGDEMPGYISAQFPVSVGGVMSVGAMSNEQIKLLAAHIDAMGKAYSDMWGSELVISNKSTAEWVNVFKKVLGDRVRAKLEAEKAQAVAKYDALKTDEEKRLDARTEIARLEAEIAKLG